MSLMCIVAPNTAFVLRRNPWRAIVPRHVWGDPDLSPFDVTSEFHPVKRASINPSPIPLRARQPPGGWGGWPVGYWFR
jgi:hypothetical protein